MKRMACVLALATGTGLAGSMATQTALADPISTAIANGLRLRFAAPGTVTSDSPITLDVNFLGGSVRSVELYVDGNRVYQQAVNTRDSQGVFHFNFKPSYLSEGDHDVMVQAVDKDGNSATSTLHLHVGPSTVDSLAHFAFPKANAMVSGVVPITVQVDASIKNPYIYFSVDGDFLSLSNYATTYNWDTTKVPNGPHTLGVKVFDEKSTAELKSLTMQVIVNNVGGLTNVQKNVSNLGGKEAGAPTLPARAIANEAASTPTDLARDGRGASLQGMRLGSGPGHYSTATAPWVRAGILVPDVQMSHSILLPESILPNSLHLVEPAFEISSGTPSTLPSTKPGHVGIVPNLNEVLAAPQDTSALHAMALESGRLSHMPVRPRRSGNIAARPNTDLDRPAAGGRIAPVVRSGQVAVKTFDVAFDNQRIAFDVPPRIENGLPLAPFRAIFEHTGGTVQWFGQSQTVRAVNSEREIEIKIGDKDAKVNNQTVTMEASPYIDHGRTIVPLSFVKDAMNVKVT
ncbi:MAG TPA: stalk domain-containing protein, partial [Chthonomonadaceae bacterium]|nr:stalk domain-containing protein [Chthonomonadaceae bacterium]